MKNTKSELNKKFGMGWIPCSERLPEEEGPYLVTLKGSDGIIGSMGIFVDCIDWYNGAWENFYCAYPEVVAWMPAPEPYEKEQP